MTAIPTLAFRLGEDSISKFEAAASRRLTEGLLLLEKGQLLASIYLLGYVAEARMKAAQYRLRGIHIHDEITAAMRNEAKQEFKTTGISLNGFPHDLEDEAVLLIYTRKKRGAGFARELRDQIMFHATALNVRWRPALRYRAVIPLPNETVVVREAAQWFHDNYAKLWS